MQTLTRPEAPAPGLILGSVVSATTEDLEAAQRYIQFELDQRKARDENRERADRTSAERRAEVSRDLEKFNAITEPLEGRLDTSALEGGK